MCGMHLCWVNSVLTKRPALATTFPKAHKGMRHEAAYVNFKIRLDTIVLPIATRLGRWNEVVLRCLSREPEAYVLSFLISIQMLLDLSNYFLKFHFKHTIKLLLPSHTKAFNAASHLVSAVFACCILHNPYYPCFLLFLLLNKKKSIVQTTKLIKQLHHLSYIS